VKNENSPRPLKTVGRNKQHWRNQTPSVSWRLSFPDFLLKIGNALAVFGYIRCPVRQCLTLLAKPSGAPFGGQFGWSFFIVHLLSGMNPVDAAAFACDNTHCLQVKPTGLALGDSFSVRERLSGAISVAPQIWLVWFAENLWPAGVMISLAFLFVVIASEIMLWNKPQAVNRPFWKLH
jgi:hypothetical protein